MERTRKSSILYITALMIYSIIVFSGVRPAWGAIAFIDVAVINTQQGTVNEGMTVIIEGKHIAQIGTTGEVTIPDGADVINAQGKYLMPGLWDMHVHWYEEPYLPLFIANGVTGIRFTSGAPQHFYWREQIKNGKLIGPRMVIASKIFDGPDPIWPGSVIVTNKREAEKEVSKAVEEKYDFIKVYAKLSRDAYISITVECSRQKILFAGHVPYSISTKEASNAGQKCIEHTGDIVRGFSKKEMELRQELLNNRRTSDLVMAKVVDSYDDNKARELCHTMIKNKTWVCPTLTLHNNYFHCDEESILHDKRLEYIPYFLRNQWQDKFSRRRKLYDEKYKLSAEKTYKGYISAIRILNNEGLDDQILAGTDVGNPYCMPGFSIHDELRLLVDSGFTAEQALRAATWNAARFLGKENFLGTIEKGKIADLVLLEADPLKNITNTTNIVSVVFDGKLFTKADIQNMLDDVKAVARRKPIQELLIKTIKGKDVAHAIRQYHDLKDKSPYDYDFSGLNGVGFQLLRMNRPSDAIEIFKLSNKVHPFFYTYYGLALAYKDHGDPELAVANCNKALELNQNFKEARKLLNLIQTKD